MSKYKKNKNTRSEINPVLKFRFGLKERISLYERLKSYIEEGFPVYESLKKFRNRYQKRKDFREKILDSWLKKMESGQSFRHAIKGWVPDAELNLIASGEEGQGLHLGLAEAIRFATSSAKIKSTIKKGVMYPMALFIIIILFIAMFSLQLAPTYLEILPLEKWPEAPLFLYGISEFIVTKWIYCLIIMVLISIIISKTIGVWTGPVREVFDKVPPWSVYKVYQSSAFLISLASMMQSGVPLNEALIKIKNSSPKWLNQYLDKMLKNLAQGGKYGDNLNVGLLDDETADDVIDYSELGRFEKAIYSIGEKNLTTAVEQIESRMAIIKNVMLVFVGVAITLIYFSSVELSASAAESTSMNQ